MTEAPQIVEVVELDFDYDPAPWSFAEAEADRIADYWAALCGRKPALFNGRVLLLARRGLARRADGGLRLTGAFFDTDFANYVAWRDWGHPGERVENCFAMAALRAADGAYLLGEMASHTLNAGHIYFPAGTPDPNDILGGKVDLDRSARRELLEETGLQPEEPAITENWTIVFGPWRIACMRPMTLALSADEAKARIDDFLRRDPHAELSRMHIGRRTEDIDEARMPALVAAYLRAAFGA